MRVDHILTFAPLWRLEGGKDRNMRVPHEIHKSFVCFGKEALCFACECINIWIFDLRNMTDLLVAPPGQRCDQLSFNHECQSLVNLLEELYRSFSIGSLTFPL